MSALVYYITVLGLFSTVVIGIDPTELKYQNIYMVLALSLGYPNRHSGTQSLLLSYSPVVLYLVAMSW